MKVLDPIPDDDFFEEEPSEGEIKLKRAELESRCKAASISFEEIEALEEGDVACRIALPCGRETRWVYCLDFSDYEQLLQTKFEQYTFLTGFDAICDYSKGEIEALIRPLSGPTSPRVAYARLFGIPQQNFNDAWPNVSLTLKSPVGTSDTTITLSPSSNELRALTGGSARHYLSIKIQREGANRHDIAYALLRRIADALFFQIDLLTDVPLSLSRDRRAVWRRKTKKNNRDATLSLDYPRAEYDSAPISLYWYARSAIGMPLLQFLAYYQVIELAFPRFPGHIR